MHESPENKKRPFSMYGNPYTQNDPFGLFVQLFGSVSRPIKSSHKHLLLLICHQKSFLLQFSKNLFVYKKFTIRGIKNGQTSREILEKSAQNTLQLSSNPVEHPSDGDRYLSCVLVIYFPTSRWSGDGAGKEGSLVSLACPSIFCLIC